MPHPMGGCWAKLERAKSTVAELEKSITDYLKPGSPHFTITSGHFNQFTEFGYTVAGKPLPLSFAVMAGEVLHHLRSALDYALWALASQKIEPGRDLQFPLCDNPSDFQEKLRRKSFKGISEQGRALIEQLQPYNSQPDPHLSTFKALSEYNNIDKHRLLLVVSAAAQIGNTIKLGDDGKATGPTVIKGFGPPDEVMVTEEGTRVFTIYFDGPHPHANAQMEIKLKAYFAPVPHILPKVEFISGLQLLCANVEDALKRLQALFDREFPPMG
ncbi:MAG TPA: hypothetical protein VHP58_00680 [Alphaproteobacteria bacterium]|nr:hypothetical protein [Alphaproteobacteria bacterium]